jgi:hypothetical protein
VVTSNIDYTKDRGNPMFQNTKDDDHIKHSVIHVKVDGGPARRIEAYNLKKTSLIHNTIYDERLGHMKTTETKQIENTPNLPKNA